MARARIEAHRWRQAWQGRKNHIRRKVMRFLTMSAALPALLSCPLWAAKWDVVPTLSLSETYTDNVSLAPGTAKHGDWITQVAPAISVAATGPRLRFNANYSPEVIYYARDHESNDIFQHLNATGNAVLADQFLFADFGADVAQHNISLQGPITNNNVNTTGNRATVASLFASPYVRHDIGSAVQAEVRYTYSVVNSSDDSTLSDSVADRINLRLASTTTYNLLPWDINYARENINYDTGQDFDSEVATGHIRRLITPTVSLLGEAGYEHYSNGQFAPASDGPSWAVGFDWAPSQVTRLTATVGQRFYGDAYALDFKHRTRLTTWSAGYHQSVTTTRSQFLIPSTTSTAGYLDTLFSTQFPDPVARKKAVDEFIARTGLPPSLAEPINIFTPQLFLQKTWNASAGLLGVRNVLIANVFKSTTEGLLGDVVLPESANSGDQTGASVQWNWRMTSRNSWNTGVAYVHNEVPSTGQVDNITYVGMGLTRQIQPRLTGSLNYRRQQSTSNQSNLNYTENAVFATMSMRF